MGLALTIEKEKNHMYTDFEDAYWKITELGYDTIHVYFTLNAYPSRDASKKANVSITDCFNIGGPVNSVYSPRLYTWKGTFVISSVFPTGIPLDEDEQKTAVYQYIKTYTGLPFEDVLEEN